MLVATAGLGASQATSSADPDTRTVKYTVTTRAELMGQISYLATQPSSRDAFVANSGKYVRRVQSPLVPGVPWVFQTTLSDPTQWALVSATGGLQVPPEFHCEIAVDGVTVVEQDGTGGVLCALRDW